MVLLHKRYFFLSFFGLVPVINSTKPVVSLDQSKHGCGENCPETLSELFVQFEELLNTIPVDETEGNGNLFTQVQETTGGTGRVFISNFDSDGSDIIPNHNHITIYFHSKFNNINIDQTEYIKSLFNTSESKFSEDLDATYIPGSKEVIYSNTTDILGETSRIVKTEFMILPGFRPFDRELLFISAEKTDVVLEENENNHTNRTCYWYHVPSVSNEWLEENVLSSSHDSPFPSFRILRAQNLYPSGDRICIEQISTRRNLSLCDSNNNYEKNENATIQYDYSYNVELIHMITTELGGLLFGPMYNNGLFSGQTQLAYLLGAQKLEDKVNERA